MLELQLSQRSTGLFRFLAVLIVTVLAATPAEADITFVNMFRNNTFVQTADGNSLTSTGSFLSLGFNFEAPGEFDAVDVTYPGPASPIALSLGTPTNFGYLTAVYPTQADMDDDFPTGTYQFDATGGGGPANTSFEYLVDAYPQTLPFLDDDSYSALQSMETAIPHFVKFSPYTPEPGVTEAYLFFTIFDQTLGSLVFNAGFLPSNTAGLNIPAGTLEPDHDFTYELIFSDRVTLDSPGAIFAAQIGFDFRTQGEFSTLPEPTTLILATTALLPAAWLVRRNRGRRVAERLPADQLEAPR